ncbi:hypothetical protein QR680_001631 [Steinernema hermaphroditum]|uniref:Uncharacterized protein n=1 Tax=Steinernema hermaphroditum TaxID=289476 RepID=A0AA39LGH4_9BILA|nr:hypothetical protein QR680_001631 [Steinernema hermaphroditum]
MGKYEGKVVIVTGSSSGIGQATAIMYAKEGACVTITGRDEERLKATKERILSNGVTEDRVLMVVGNVQEEQCAKALVTETIAKWNRIDILINNAGVTVKPDVDPESLETFDYIFSINLRGVIQLTKLVLPHLMATKGNVVSVSSVVAYRPIPDLSYYSMTKAALDHFTRLFAIKYAKNNVRFNNVNPGFTKTSIFTRHRPIEDEQAVLQEIVPMGRMAKSDEIADAILFLTSNHASYITGTTLVVDGGFCILTQETGRF